MKKNLFVFLLLSAIGSAGLSQDNAGSPGVIKRSFWSYDRADLAWPNDKVPEKKDGPIFAPGWMEFDFESPAPGWYELYRIGGPHDWQRDIFLDGKRFKRGNSPKEDKDPQANETYKEANLYLAAGRHTLRYRQLNHPAGSACAWELRPGKDNPAASVFAEMQGFNILRKGEKLILQVSGGSAKPMNYELMTRNILRGGDERRVAEVAFPASKGRITKNIVVPCDEEGVFELRARANGQRLRPADLMTWSGYIVVDTQHAPAPTARVERQLIHDIDCVAQTDMGQPIKPNEGYWEANGQARTTTSQAGTYRESGDNLDPDIPLAPNEDGSPGIFKSLAGFSYAADVPATGGPYLVEMDYPDDDRRTVNLIIMESAPKAQGLDYPVNQLGSGYETGDWFPLTQQMQTHQAVFWTNNRKIRIAVMSMNPGMRAAAARIRVYQMVPELPVGPQGRPGGRIFASFMEEPGRWGAHFRSGGMQGTSMEQDFVAIERWIQTCRWVGLNCLWPTEAIYQMPTYNSDALEGWFVTPYDAPRLVALLCEKYGMKYVPELHISGQYWFDTRVMSKLAGNADELFAWNRLGTRGGGNNWIPTYNALHPAIQQKYIEIVGELVDRVSDSPAFAGLSSRLMAWCWQSWNGLASLNWGYEDWTISQFEKETGIRVPGTSGDPQRFKQRFEFLAASDMREKWLAWRCGRMMDYYKRLRDRIRKNRPDAVLFLPYFPANNALDNLFGALSDTPSEGLREVGIDLNELAHTPGIAVVPTGTFGRRDSAPVKDQQEVFDPLLDPAHKALGFGYERAFGYVNAYFEVHSRIPVNKLGFPELTPGAYCGAADGAGRHCLERLSVVLADQDSGVMFQGGLGHTYGQPKYFNEWLAEYTRLPKLPFEPLAGLQDPVAVWQRKCDDGLYFYAVNREPNEIKLRLRMEKTTAVTSLGSGAAVSLNHGMLELTLLPYQLRAFKAAKGAVLRTGDTILPVDSIELVKQRLAACQQLGEAITSGGRHDDVTTRERDAFFNRLKIAWREYQAGNYWRCRTALSMAPMVTVFQRLAAWPSSQLHRSRPDILETERTGLHEVPAAAMMNAEVLAGMVVRESNACLVASSAYNSDWLHTKVLQSESGELDVDLDVPVSGRYRLSLGHVAGSEGAIMVSLGGKGFSTLAVTSRPNRPERTVFAVIALKAGKIRLSLRRTDSFGVYGVTLQPECRPLPSKAWATIGPFPSPWGWPRLDAESVKEALAAVFPPEREQNFAAAYQGGIYQGADQQKNFREVAREVRWQFTEQAEGIHSEAGVNFLNRAGVNQGGICYALTYITSPEERDARLLIGTDWWADAFLNGERVRSGRDAKLVAADGAAFNGWTPLTATVHLKKGSNTLLVKNHGGSVANWFTGYISDPGDLKIGPKPE